MLGQEKEGIVGPVNGIGAPMHKWRGNISGGYSSYTERSCSNSRGLNPVKAPPDRRNRPIAAAQPVVRRAP